MYGLRALALAVEAAANVHETGIVDRGANVCAGLLNAVELVGEHGGRHIAVLNCECASEAAALVGAA